ncbi:MAG: hypothetical protein HOL05_01165, partial [Nitrospinaceae bacterium]|nr:hypothetical protein [Nitrospinaceae bacterium]
IYNPLQYDFLKDLEPINVTITLGALMLGIGQIIFALNIFGSLWKLNMNWYRKAAQVISSYLTAFVAYKFVTFYFEGLTKPTEPTMVGRTIAGIVAIVVFAWIYRYLSAKMGELGETAPQNPWNANTLEWVAPVIPPHGNFGPTLPEVHRGPYEYSVPGESDDWAPQTKPLSDSAAAASH